ncbi:hypothetical protein, partial [Kitasatospora herbaricolor]|uniref:hypothetical protein n=1 Tax=Kitasatospora herbaricolor TaxID=68217 RepID=UPI0036DA4F1C
TSLWPDGVEEFRQHVVVKRFLREVSQDDHVLSALAGRLRVAQLSGQREAIALDVKNAIAEYARDLIADRLNRPLALLFFRILLDRPTSNPRFELESGLDAARDRVMTVRTSATESALPRLRPKQRRSPHLWPPRWWTRTAMRSSRAMRSLHGWSLVGGWGDHSEVAGRQQVGERTFSMLNQLLHAGA